MPEALFLNVNCGQSNLQGLLILILILRDKAHKWIGDRRLKVDQGPLLLQQVAYTYTRIWGDVRIH